MIEQLITGLLEIWQLSSIIIAIGGGLVGGIACAFLLVPRDVMALTALRWYVIHTATMITTLFTIFWIGQVVEAVLTADPLWGRVVGRFGLTLLFSILVGVGIWLGLRIRTRDWRLRP